MNQVQRVNTLAIIGAVLLFGYLFVQHIIRGNMLKNAPILEVDTSLIQKTATSSGQISHGDTAKKQVIFTFDGGSGSQSTEKILEVLKKHSVKGTFFLTGKFIESNPNVVQQIHDQWHEIFNHTYDHPHLTTLSDEQIVLELNKMEMAFTKLTGSSTKPYFRPPFGDVNDRVRTIAAQNGYQSVYWSTDALDWEESTGMTADKVTKKILDNVKPGNIYLMHLGDYITGNILDDVFTKIESQGYKIVSLTQGL